MTRTKGTNQSKKKKSVTEGDFEVITKDTSPGAKVTATAKDVKAISADAAMKAANPTGAATGSEEVIVRKKDPRADPANPSNHGVLGENKLPSKRDLQQVQYPYRLGLPGTFSSLVEAVDLSYKKIGDSIVLRFVDANILHETMSRLSKLSDRRATVVLDGIKRSI